MISGSEPMSLLSATTQTSLTSAADLPAPGFLRKYHDSHLLCQILWLIVPWLEKDRNYVLASFILTNLILFKKSSELSAEGAPDNSTTNLHKISSSLSDSSKRGQWWLRLAIDLKHLRLRLLAFSIVKFALLNDKESVKTGIKN